jgi:hypothetical protein
VEEKHVRTITGSSRRTTLAALVLLLVAHRGSPAGQSATPAPRATCVFTNPAFSGKCTEMTTVASGSTPAQACQSILQCLNNVNCLKTYCEATTVRTGWKLESAR